MKRNEPESETKGLNTLKLRHQRARNISIIVCVLSVMFLLAWFLLLKDQTSFNVLVYCLSPLLMFLILNIAFSYAYKRGKD